MFDEIFFPRTAEKHRAAPLAEPRARYLRHLREIGTCRSALRKCANDHLNLVRLLNLQEDDRISIHGIETAATIWSRPKGRRCDEAATAQARKRFISHGIDLLRFLGWLDEVEIELRPHHAEMTAYEHWLRRERGLSEATIESYCRPPTTSSVGSQEQTFRSSTSVLSISTTSLRRNIGAEPGTGERHMITRSG